ncbi:MAG: glycosyltransferase family 4 protein [Pyrinomonadaceae bacterium]
MPKAKHQALLVSAHPIQNAQPMRLMAGDARVDVLTAYCSLPEARLWQDPEQRTREAFDIPVLDGYKWQQMRNYSPRPRLGKFYGLINPGVIKLVSESDCCVVYGHAYVSFWLAIITAKLRGKPLLLGTDATYLESQYGGSWKAAIKKKVLPFLYNRIADLVLVPSTAAKRFICSLGVAADRVALTPYVVDNDYIADIAASTDIKAIRQKWQIPAEGIVAVFCAKFLARKRPQDALQAFAQADVPNSFLLMVGDGPLGEELRREAKRLRIEERVRFTGMVKYSHLPALYAASDLLVFPSGHEPYGLPVNEAMICGIPVVVSDRVGAGLDLVENGRTGFVYPSGDVDALASILRKVLADRELLKKMGAAARLRISNWSPRENAEATILAVEKAIIARQARARAQAAAQV